MIVAEPRSPVAAFPVITDRWLGPSSSLIDEPATTGRCESAPTGPIRYRRHRTLSLTGVDRVSFQLASAPSRQRSTLRLGWSRVD